MEMIAGVKSTGDNELDWASWAKTEKEIQRGYAEGPFDLEEFDLHCIVLLRDSRSGKERMMVHGLPGTSQITNAPVATQQWK